MVPYRSQINAPAYSNYLPLLRDTVDGYRNHYKYNQENLYGICAYIPMIYGNKTEEKGIRIPLLTDPYPTSTLGRGGLLRTNNLFLEDAIFSTF